MTRLDFPPGSAGPATPGMDAAVRAVLHGAIDAYADD
jgi:hypothetical protein